MKLPCHARAPLALLTGVLCAAAAQASPSLLFDRGLPTANFNDAAGANRSNQVINYGSNNLFAGDDFQLGSSMTGWNVNKIRTWVVGSASASFLGDFYKSVALYVGEVDADGLQRVVQASVAAGGDTASSNNGVTVTATRVQYFGGAEYQDDERRLAIYQLDFDNLALHFASDALVQFGVQMDGLGHSVGAYNHASNAALSGSPQAGADGRFRQFGIPGGTPGTADFQGFSCTGFEVDCDMGWDKASDINVQVFGSSVPEPASWALSGIALLALAGARRRGRPSA